MTKLCEILKEASDFLGKYLEDNPRILLLLTDMYGKILDCNKGFMNSLRLNEKPKEKGLFELTKERFRICSLQESREGKLTLHFLNQEGLELPMDGRYTVIGDKLLFIFESQILAQKDLIEKLSLLNNEIVDITRQLRKKTLELEASNRKIKRIMNTDPLTGLMNRRAFFAILKKEISFSRRHQIPLAVTMADVDHFKKINDTFGHDIGDKVLKRIANTIKRMVRAEDTLARYGGEEFVLLFPKTDKGDASSVVERIRKKIESQSFYKVRSVTVSFGITALGEGDTITELLKRADEALYMAKAMGRNRCVVL